jgi:RNA polymerase sigma-70 factor (ECF subfamily)
MADPDMEGRPEEAQGTGSRTSMTLLDRVRANDQQAWRRLVYLYTPLVTSWCRRRGVREADVDDVTQDVFRKAFTAMETFRRDRPGDTFRGWLRVIARTQALDHHRLRGRQPLEAQGGTSAGLLLSEAPEMTRLDDEKDDEELKALYRRALELVQGEFQEKTWRAFWRVAVDGVDTTLIATELGMSVVSVRQSKSRVLRRLREELGDLVA